MSANHVVGEIADRAAGQRRKPRKAHGMIAFCEPPQFFDGVIFELDTLVAAFERTIASARAKHFRGIGAGKGVARDVLAALDAFEQKGILSVAGEAKMRANRREQIGRVGFIRPGTRLPCFARRLNSLKSGWIIFWFHSFRRAVDGGSFSPRALKHARPPGA